jgi:hypothetical protein
LIAFHAVTSFFPFDDDAQRLLERHLDLADRLSDFDQFFVEVVERREARSEACANVDPAAAARLLRYVFRFRLCVEFDEVLLEFGEKIVIVRCVCSSGERQ